MKMLRVAATFLIALSCFAISSARGEIIVFRNIANTPIRFSIRADNATAPDTQELAVGGTISFNLTATGRFDICATGLDALNGTFGSSNVSLRELQAQMNGNIVDVDGILKRSCITHRDERLAILLKFPLKSSRAPYVLQINRASQAYIDWFYESDVPRVGGRLSRHGGAVHRR